MDPWAVKLKRLRSQDRVTLTAQTTGAPRTESEDKSVATSLSAGACAGGFMNETENAREGDGKAIMLTPKAITVSTIVRRNIGMMAPCMNKVSDPIQQLFLDKIREYKSKSSGGKLVDPTPEIQKELKSDLERLSTQYGGWNVPPAHTATHYNPSQSYNPSGGYHPPPNTGYHLPPNTGYHPPPNTGYNHPPAQAPPQTIIVESEKRGLGTLAKEAAVGAVVGVAVNAAANRFISGGIYGNNHPGYAAAPPPAGAPAVAPGVTHTEIVYNNYYGNGTGPAPGDPGQAPPNPAVPQQIPGQYPAQPPSSNYY
ncbi:hypothetical protein G9C98_006857, partial [Cotesia typhae]